jgi:hypothetical protein
MPPESFEPSLALMEVSHDVWLIACRDCSVLQPLMCMRSPGADDAVEVSREAYHQFFAEHHAHDLTWLTRYGDELTSDRALWDPMATVTFEVTDGRHAYIATGSRTSLEEPRVYRFAPGTLDAMETAILVDDKDLRRALDVEFYPHALRLGKLDRFVVAVRQVVSHLNPAELPIAFDDANDPMVSVARMPDQSYEELVARCTEIFDPAEMDTVSKFLRDNRDEDGLLALRVRRELRALSD